jgi:hypothetical protein
MNYVIATLTDQATVEAACAVLKQELPPENINVVGNGYKRIEDYAFLDPEKRSRQRAYIMAAWLVPFGFISGFAFNVQTGYQLVSWAGSLGNHVIGGLFGAIGGVMGSFFIGGGFVNLSSDNDNSPPYRDRLKAGKYLVIVNGAPNITNKASRILRQIKAENIQTLVDAARV